MKIKLIITGFLIILWVGICVGIGIVINKNNAQNAKNAENSAMTDAYLRGKQAARLGMGASSNPYGGRFDIDKSCRIRWFDGYASEEEAKLSVKQ